MAARNAVVFCGCWILFVVSSALSHELYVAPDGKDPNPGTKDRPVATLIRARDLVRQLKGSVELVWGSAKQTVNGSVLDGLPRREYDGRISATQRSRLAAARRHRTHFPKDARKQPEPWLGGLPPRTAQARRQPRERRTTPSSSMATRGRYGYRLKPTKSSRSSSSASMPGQEA